MHRKNKPKDIESFTKNITSRLVQDIELIANKIVELEDKQKDLEKLMKEIKDIAFKAAA